MFKPFINDIPPFKEQRVAGYYNNGFSETDKAIIKYYHEKGYTAYKKWQEALGQNFDEATYKEIWSIWYHGNTKRFWPSDNSDNSWKRKSRKGNDLFSRRSSWDSCALKRYCQGIKDFTIFCTENDQKKKNKTIQTSQNALHEWYHSKKKSRMCWLPAWKIWNKSNNDWARSFLR